MSSRKQQPTRYHAPTKSYASYTHIHTCTQPNLCPSTFISALSIQYCSRFASFQPNFGRLLPTRQFVGPVEEERQLFYSARTMLTASPLCFYCVFCFTLPIFVLVFYFLVALFCFRPAIFQLFPCVSLEKYRQFFPHPSPHPSSALSRLTAVCCAFLFFHIFFLHE